MLHIARATALLALLPLAAFAQSPPSQSPAPFHLIEATVDSTHAVLRSGQLTCTRLVQAYLDRIAAYDQAGPKLNAVQSVNPDALVHAARLDAQFQASGLVGPLHCITVAVKDEIETNFMPTTYGSAIFKHFTPPRNATVIDRLQSAGAIILTKANLGEFVFSYAGSAFGHCRNAYDPQRDPSGSSCGTGVSVAANLAAVGIGEDTGGSIRGPASHGSAVGLRPTLPLVSRYGMMPVAPTRDTIGPITRTVRDAAILLDVIAGYDPNDPVTAQSFGRKPASYRAFLEPNGLRGMRLGVIREPIIRDADPTAADFKELQNLLSQAVKDLTARGAEVIDPIVIPRMMELWDQSGSGSLEVEPATNAYLAEFPNAPLRTLKEIADSPLLIASRRSDLIKSLGRSTGELAYLKEEQAREALRVAVFKVMADNRFDALLYLSVNHEPVLVPKPTPGRNGRFAGILAFPAIAVPAGFTMRGLPIGIEFLGRPFSEGILLKAAYDYEQTTRHRHPPATAPALSGEP
jgi:Asp-tRNA(Asn)/Glu-tRNA(Gln) amidotransferase A subunit family amidase